MTIDYPTIIEVLGWPADDGVQMLPFVDTWTDCRSCRRRLWHSSRVDPEHVIQCECGARMAPSRDAKMEQA